MGSGGPRGLQNRSGLTTSGWVGSIPTHSRHRLAAVGALLALLLGSVALPRPISAQLVRGRVLLPDSLTPAPAVLVTATVTQRTRDPSAVPSRSSQPLRVVTDARGEFRLQLPEAGTVQLRSLRVGFRPTEHPVVEVAPGDTVEVRLVVADEAVRLSAIAVRRSDPCRARHDGRARVADVWEEARKALLLANDRRTDDPLLVEWIAYDRQFDSLGVRLLDQVVRVTRAPSERPFRSQDAALLARDGYVVEDDDGVAYHAPDADVLLSESFAATHCFHLVADDSLGGRLGIRFRPSTRDRARRDVEGTLWLDRASARLQTLDFSFTGLPEVAARAGAGGRIEFSQLPDGAWLVSRWWIRMPALERVRVPSVVGARVRVSGSTIVLRRVQVVGGEIVRVERGDREVYRAQGSSLLVRLSSTEGGPPGTLAGARVSLDGTDYEALSDADGIARFPHVLPGAYRVAASASDGRSIPSRTVHRDVLVQGDSAHELLLRLPPGRADATTPQATRTATGGGERTTTTPIRGRREVLFTVADSLGNAVADVDIIATDAARRVHRARSDSLGSARMVDPPPGELRVEARRIGYHLALGTVSVEQGVTLAHVLLERVQAGTLLDTMRITADADERARYAAFDERRRTGTATATITRDDLEVRRVVNAWQMLLSVPSVQLIEGPEGVLPVSRRTTSMDLLSGGRVPCYLRMAIDGVLLPDVPVNIARRMPPVPEIHGIEVFAGPASIPTEYAGDQRNMGCGLIVVWTR